MKPVVKASIGKTAFTLDESANSILKDYLDSLEQHFSGNPSGKEIMEEIEVRLAELLFEKCGVSGVVSEQAARDACDTLGSVNDIDSDKSAEEAAAEEQKPNDKDVHARKARKLFRNPDDKIIGGVCSGMAAYFDREPVLFRLIAIGIFLLFVFTEARQALWVPVVAYLALWLVIPEAKTIGQKYQMRGKTNTLDSIMKNVEKGAEEIGNTAKQFNNNHPDFLKTIMKAVSVFVGIIFILIAFAAMLALAVSAAGATVILPVSIATLLASTIGPGHTAVCTIALLATLGIPFISLLYCGIQMAFGLKSPKWRPGILLLLLWIASLLTLGYFVTRAAIEFDSGERQYDVMTVSPQEQMLLIEMENSDMDYDYIYLNGDEDSYELVMTVGDEVYLYPRIKIHRNDEADSIRIKESTIFFSGKNRQPEFCSYSDGTLILSPSVLNDRQKMEESGREITISLPADTEVQVKAPRYHDFTKEQYHTNITLLKGHSDVDIF